MNGKPRDRLIVALDVDTLEEAERLLDLLAPAVGLFKVGSRLFTARGPAAAAAVKKRGKRLFLDLKFHDIPNTVAGAVAAAVDLGVDMLTVHTTGGEAMLRACLAAGGERARDLGRERPALLGVTVLTSLDQATLRSVWGMEGRSLEEEVISLAQMAKEAGIDGVVASPREIRSVKECCGHQFTVVTPGIRPGQGGSDDQVRTMTPGEAIALGADYLVVGRPIVRATDPLDAANAIVREMEEASGGEK